METNVKDIPDELVINGKYYPMWSQFILKKDEWIGGRLIEVDDILHTTMETKIKDIGLTPNGPDSAYFMIVGRDFTFGFDVRHGGIGSSPMVKGGLHLACKFSNATIVKP